MSLSLPLAAQEKNTLEPIQVSATRFPRDRHSTAASITILKPAEQRQDSAGVALSDYLGTVPGVLARSRQNLAQDEQISVRGFGTRASFGLRGVRLYVDGLPATMPDGQGQTAHFPLASTERIEVLRGPFSALYGNASGGVISVFTPDGGGAARMSGSLTAGSSGVRRAHASLETRTGADSGLFVAASILDVAGWRRHSSAIRNSLYGKWHTSWGGGELTLIANVFRMPKAEDPQGLTLAEARVNPRAQSAAAARFNTRKTVTQDQFGAIYEWARQNSGLRILFYSGRRRIEQVLFTPEAAQRNPLSAGGWIDLDSPFQGLDARWMAVHGNLEWVAGVSVETQRQYRRGHENFIGSTVGVRGALRLRQEDTVRSVDPYLQATWHFAPAWRFSAGVRRTDVRFRSRDDYIKNGNPDDSGSVRHGATLPVVGLTWAPRPDLSFFASAGRGFETPTFNELAYRSDGGSGPNFALRPMRTRSVEMGMRAGNRAGLMAEVSAFRTDTRDELAVGSSFGGRTSFQNAGRAKREGLEGALVLPLTPRLQLEGNATLMRARYQDSFPSCAGLGCISPLPVARGTPIPGVPDRQARMGLRYGVGKGWEGRFSAHFVDAVSVRQSGDERAPGYTVLDASVGYSFEKAGRQARVFVAMDNLADRFHIGSVIVNEANGRFFEPGPGRSWYIGFELK